MAKAKGGEAAVTDEELANLSPEEQEALEGDDDAADAAAAKAAAEKGDDDDEPAPEKGKGAEDKGKKKPAAAEEEEDPDADAGEGADKSKGKDAKGKDADADADAGKDAKGKEKGAEKAAAAADADADEPEEEDEPLPEFPRYKAAPVEDYDKKMKALDDRQAEAEKKFKDGDMELDALRAEDRKIEKERRELETAKLKHDISVEQTTQADQQAWQYEINRFMHQVKKADDIDYRNNRTLNAALDQAVKDLGNAKDKDGNLLHADKPGRWFLREGHRQVMKDIGRKPAAAADDAGLSEAEKKERADAAAKARKPDGKKLPKTLAKVPPADDEAGDDPEFGHLSGLDGLELEDAVARMTPAQQDKWARSSGTV